MFQKFLMVKIICVVSRTVRQAAIKAKNEKKEAKKNK